MPQLSKQKYYVIFLLSPSIWILVPMFYQVAKIQRFDIAGWLILCLILICLGSIPSLMTAWISVSIKPLYKSYIWLGLTILAGIIVSLVPSIILWLLFKDIRFPLFFALMGGICSLFSGLILLFWDKTNDSL